MSPLTAINQTVARSATFSGRASRSKYWRFMLALTVIFAVYIAVDAMMIMTTVQTQGCETIFTLRILDLSTTFAWIVTPPTLLNVTIWRLYDAGFPGLWLALYFVPLGALAQ